VKQKVTLILGKENMAQYFSVPTSQLSSPYLWATSLRQEYRIFFSKHLSFRFSRNLTSDANLRESFELREGSFISWHTITSFRTLNNMLKKQLLIKYIREKQFLKKYPNVLIVLLQQNVRGGGTICHFLRSQE